MVTAGVTAILILLLYVTVAVLFFHFVPARRPIFVMQVVFALCVLLGFPAFELVHELRLDTDRWTTILTVLYSGILFTGLSYSYLQAFILLEQSITIRMLVHILHSGRGTMTVEELEQVYPFTEVITRKAGLAAASGALECIEKDGHKLYRNAKLGQSVGRVSSGLKGFLNWGNGG